MEVKSLKSKAKSLKLLAHNAAAGWDVFDFSLQTSDFRLSSRSAKGCHV